MCLGKPGAGSLARLESALIFEQAFMAMPEFLTGTPFSEYQFEATIANAFSLAILQELNSRNVQNPISLLRSEVLYHGTSKHADVHINLSSLNIFNENLVSYGFYQDNWLEAKFFRLSNSGQPNIPPLHSTYLLLKDVLRLCMLVQDAPPGADSSSGRYLLHAYQDSPSQYLVYKRNSGGSRTERAWLSPLITPGEQRLVISDLGKERTKSFESNVGKKAALYEVDAQITNFVHKPRTSSPNVYYIVLTRINDFKISKGNLSYGRNNGRTFGNLRFFQNLALSADRRLA